MSRDLETRRALAVQVVTVAQIGQLNRVRCSCGEDAIQAAEHDRHAGDANHLTCVDVASYVSMRRLRSLPKGGAAVRIRLNGNDVRYNVGCRADIAAVVTRRDVISVGGRGAHNGRLRQLLDRNASFTGLLDDHLTDGLRRRRLNGAVDRHLFGFTGLANLGEVWLVDDNWVEGRFSFGFRVSITL